MVPKQGVPKRRFLKDPQKVLCEDPCWLAQLCCRTCRGRVLAHRGGAAVVHCGMEPTPEVQLHTEGLPGSFGGGRWLVEGGWVWWAKGWLLCLGGPNGSMTCCRGRGRRFEGRCPFLGFCRENEAAVVKTTVASGEPGNLLDVCG